MIFCFGGGGKSSSSLSLASLSSCSAVIWTSAGALFFTWNARKSHLTWCCSSPEHHVLMFFVSYCWIIKHFCIPLYNDLLQYIFNTQLRKTENVSLGKLDDCVFQYHSREIKIYFIVGCTTGSMYMNICLRRSGWNDAWFFSTQLYSGSTPWSIQTVYSISPTINNISLFCLQDLTCGEL